MSDAIDLAELRRPFTWQAVKYKPQTVKKDKSAALASFYIDARLAAERLNAVVGAEDWSDSYRPLFEDQASAHQAFHFPVECSLVVRGVTRVDVGIYQKNGADSLAVKSAYSDAFKRAAVKFGVGAYLYALPKVWADVKTYGTGDNIKVDGFSPAGVAKLRDAYAAWLKTSAFGDVLDHGDVGTDDDTEPEPVPDAPVAPPSEAMESLTQLGGRLARTVGETQAKAAYRLLLQQVKPADAAHLSEEEAFAMVALMQQAVLDAEAVPA